MRCSPNSLKLTAVAVMAIAAFGLVAPASAEDSSPPRPGQQEGSCANPIAGLPDSPSGTIVTYPVPVGTPIPGIAGKYLCLNGRWVWLGPDQTGPVFMIGAPDLTIDHPTVEVDEGKVALNTGFVGAVSGEAVVLTASVGAISVDSAGNWTWTSAASDGPASRQVSIFAIAGDLVHEETFDLVIANVAPSVTSVTPSSTTAVTGQPITFTGTAIDPSASDTTSGFAWSFDGTAASSSSVTTSFETCGLRTVTATAADVDGAVSEPFTSAAVTVVNARLGAPLSAAAANVVKAGQVVPIRLEVGCDGVSLGADLSPRLSVLAGEVGPEVVVPAPALTVPFTGANDGDSSGTMRLSGGAYLYNLRVPAAAPGSLFTVRIRLFHSSAAIVSVVLKIRD